MDPGVRRDERVLGRLWAGGDGIAPLHAAAGSLTQAWRDDLAARPPAATAQAAEARARALTPH